MPLNSYIVLRYGYTLNSNNHQTLLPSIRNYNPSFPTPAWKSSAPSHPFESQLDPGTGPSRDSFQSDTPLPPPSTSFNFQIPPISNAKAGPSKYTLPSQGSPDSDTDSDLPARVTATKGKKRANTTQETLDKPPVPKKPKVALPAKPKKVKTEVKERAVAKRGRKPGSVSYQTVELIRLLRYINEKLPIGNAGWDWVAEKYNKWAKENGFVERVGRALRCKYDAVSIEK
jgi:hypothetical protein